MESRKSASLHCLVERFGGRTAKLTLVDLAKPQSAAQTLHGQRAGFGEQFRRMLQREFPDWQVTTLTSEMDLTRSFSPVFPRAILERRSTTQVARGVPVTRRRDIAADICAGVARPCATPHAPHEGREQPDHCRWRCSFPMERAN